MEAAILLILLAFPLPVSQAQLAEGIVNGDFETGQMAPWTHRPLPNEGGEIHFETHSRVTGDPGSGSFVLHTRTGGQSNGHSAIELFQDISSAGITTDKQISLSFYNKNNANPCGSVSPQTADCWRIVSVIIYYQRADQTESSVGWHRYWYCDGSACPQWLYMDFGLEGTSTFDVDDKIPLADRNAETKVTRIVLDQFYKTFQTRGGSSTEKLEVFWDDISLTTEHPRLFVEAQSSGTVFVGMGPGSSLRGGVGSGSERFTATGECSPVQGSLPDSCAFDFSTLQGSGVISAAWEEDRTQYSLEARISISSTPNPENRIPSASDSADTFVIWDLSFDATLSTGSSTLAFTARGFIWAIAPPFATQCCGLESRSTTILLGETIGVPPGTELPFLGIALIWLSEPQAFRTNGSSIDVPAADLVKHLVTTALAVHVEIDIKPGSFPNSIDPESRGKIPVAILSSPGFDAPSQVNPATLTFGRTGDEQSLAFCQGSGDEDDDDEARVSNSKTGEHDEIDDEDDSDDDDEQFEDVNGDGLRDLVCHFFTRMAAFQAGDTEGILRGQLFDGSLIEGTDSVRIIAHDDDDDDDDEDDENGESHEDE